MLCYAGSQFFLPLFSFRCVGADAYQELQQPRQVHGVEGKAQEGFPEDTGDRRDGVLSVQAGKFSAVKFARHIYIYIARSVLLPH